MKIGILGGGLSGASLAYFLQDSDKIKWIDVLEKESQVGGLCRSYDFHQINYDTGPHILFSKDKEILEFILNQLGSNVSKYRRCNKVFYKGVFVKYPFENGLGDLPEEDRNYCVNSFLNNPYEKCRPKNMLEFFLKTFGEGITNTYLRPYNEKIWKFAPALMDTQMVERIPKPPREDILKSAKGISTEGYLHQLNFYYPKSGGIEALVKSFVDKFGDKVDLIPNYNVSNISKNKSRWLVKNNEGDEKEYDKIVSTIPIPVLTDKIEGGVPADAGDAVEKLQYNSIITCAMAFKKDHLGDKFAIMVPDREILFHRVSKVNFLMRGTKDSASILLAEITYRKGDSTDKMSDSEIEERLINDLTKLGFIEGQSEHIDSEVNRHEYAYVIYDLDHKEKLRVIKKFYEEELGIILCGRFGEFEYLNMDAVIRRALDKSEGIKSKL